MVKIAISVEGLTEEIFVKTIIKPYLMPKRIIIETISNLSGNVSLDRTLKDIRGLAHNHNYVTTMYDFYGFKKLDKNETKTSLEAKIKNGSDSKIAHKVFPYIQMYEFEGLLFSSPQSLKNHLNSTEKVESWAQMILGEFNNNPENINNSTETAPSKRLEKFTDYRKTTHGPNIAKEIGIEGIREKCPGFNDWITLIESWAK